MLLINENCKLCIKDIKGEKMERLGAEKIFYHSERLLDIKNRGDTFPVHIELGLTEYCCHRCIFCYSEFATADTARTATLNKEVLLNFLGEAKEYGLKSVTLVGSGEPLLHPDIVDILYSIKELGLDIGIFTNGSKITEEIRGAMLDTCTFVRFSINASNAMEHEFVHQIKGDFDNVVNNVKKLVESRAQRKTKLPTIGTQMVFFEETYRSIVQAARLWKEVGVDYFEIKPVIAGAGSSVNKKVFPAKDVEDVLRLMAEARQLSDESYVVYTKDEQYKVTRNKINRNYDYCYACSLDMNLWANGDLFYCANLEQPKHIIGNIYKQSFIEIWQGEKRREIREHLNIKACPAGCRGHFSNEVIWDYLYPDEECHPNFI